MTITYLVDQNLIKVEAPEITTFVADIDNYSTVTTTGNKCGSGNTVIPYDTTEILNVNSQVYIIGNILYIRPTFFGSSVFVDNIYKFSIKFTLEGGGYTLIENCIFIDITYKCKVAAYLKNIIEENADVNDNEKISTIIHLLHYSLVNGSNCGCNCSQLCEVFNELKLLLLNTKPENTNCGC